MYMCMCVRVCMCVCVSLSLSLSLPRSLYTFLISPGARDQESYVLKYRLLPVKRWLFPNDQSQVRTGNDQKRGRERGAYNIHAW